MPPGAPAPVTIATRSRKRATGPNLSRVGWASGVLTDPAGCGFQCVDTQRRAMDCKDAQAQSLSPVAVVDRSQIAYRLAGGTKWVSAVTPAVRRRANLEG